MAYKSELLLLLFSFIFIKVLHLQNSTKSNRSLGLDRANPTHSSTSVTPCKDGFLKGIKELPDHACLFSVGWWHSFYYFAYLFFFFFAALGLFFCTGSWMQCAGSPAVMYFNSPLVQNIKDLFIYFLCIILFIFGCAGSFLLHTGFFLWWFLLLGLWALEHGLSSCGPRA